VYCVFFPFFSFLFCDDKYEMRDGGSVIMNKSDNDSLKSLGCKSRFRGETDNSHKK